MGDLVEFYEKVHTTWARETVHEHRNSYKYNNNTFKEIKYSENSSTYVLNKRKYRLKMFSNFVLSKTTIVYRC